MAVERAVLKIGPFKISIPGKPLGCRPSLASTFGLSEYVLHGTPAALVEPKKKSQGPAAKAKRLRGLRENPDVIEAVQEERLVAQRHSDGYDRVYVLAQKMIERFKACLGEREDTVELKKKYIEQLERNKVLVDAIQGYKGLIIATQSETTEALRATIKAQDEMLELINKRA
jgi:hypothetical protein